MNAPTCPAVMDTMTETYETPRLLGQPSNAHSYHTQECRTVRASSSDPKEASVSLIEWHGLEECEYCSGTHTPSDGPNKTVVADD